MAGLPPELSWRDVERLRADETPETRIEIAAGVAARFDAATLNRDERQVAEGVLRDLMKDAEVRVREALATQLRSCSELPRDMALALARDVESVALPILQYSEVLSDADLIEILRSGSPDKQVAIAGRARVSAQVAEELLDTGNETAVGRLVANRGAELDARLLGRAVAEYGHSEQVCSSLAARPQLPPALSEQLMEAVTRQLLDQLVQNNRLPTRVIKTLLQQAHDRATISMFSEGAHSDAELEAVLARLEAQGRLSTSLAFRALSLGDMRFFEMAMARLARIPLGNARTLIHDEGDLGLQAILQNALATSQG